MTEYGLGRLHAPDDRDFALRQIMQVEEPTRAWRYWNKGPWQGDQGNTSQCVGYSCAHWLHTGPVTNRSATPTTSPFLDPAVIYREAQRVDEWTGEDYDGTSVRAGAKTLQARGLIASYYFGSTLADVTKCLLTTGPVVMGTSWYDSMFEPDSRGMIKVEGELVGGHAYLLTGVNMIAEEATFQNSWGLDFGVKGSFKMKFSDLDRLIREDGEAMLAVETKAA